MDVLIVWQTSIYAHLKKVQGLGVIAQNSELKAIFCDGTAKTKRAFLVHFNF